MPLNVAVGFKWLSQELTWVASNPTDTSQSSGPVVVEITAIFYFRCHKEQA